MPTVCQPLSHMSIHSGNKHLLITFCLSGIVLDAESAEVNETRGGGHRWKTGDNHKEHVVVFSFYGWENSDSERGHKLTTTNS